MTLTRPLLISAAIVAASAALGVWAYGQLPDHAAAAIHFNAQGQPNGFADKARAFAILPVVNAAVLALLAVLPRLRGQKGLAASQGPYGLMLMGISAVMLVSQAGLVAHALNGAVDVLRPVFVAVGALFALLGNVLGKVRHNFVFGVRTPWTLMNETVWDKTNRFTGRLMFAAGLVLVLASLVAPNSRTLVGVMIACASVPALAGVVYSWAIFPKAPTA
jgi:uncharacterized membrane protein